MPIPLGSRLITAKVQHPMSVLNPWSRSLPPVRRGDRASRRSRQILPPRPQSGDNVSFSGGGYFYLDNQGRVVLVTTTQEIRIYSVQSNHFVLDRSYDLSPVITTPGDLLNSVLPDNVGNLWFISKD